jgi:hypothetical protein
MRVKQARIKPQLWQALLPTRSIAAVQPSHQRIRGVFDNRLIISVRQLVGSTPPGFKPKQPPSKKPYRIALHRDNLTPAQVTTNYPFKTLSKQNLT